MSWLIHVSAMNGQKNTAGGSKTGGRNKTRIIARKNVNRCSTLTLAMGNTVPAGGVPGPSETVAATDAGMEAAQASTALPEPTNCKKRSVVGGTEAEEGVAPKKAKTDDTPAAKKQESRIFRNTRLKKHKKNRVFKDQDDEEEMESTPATSSTDPAPAPAPQAGKKLKRKADKAKPKVGDQNDSMQTTDDVVADKKTDDTNNNLPKKQRKRKHQKKQTKMDTEDEPNIKMQKKSLDSLASLDKEIMDVLEKMNEEHNQVTDMIDDMVPYAPVPYRPPNENIALHYGNDWNEFDLTEVVQWTQDNWDKDSAEATIHYTSIHFVVVENLPIVMMPVYKHKLTDLFEKYGTVTHIGLPEVTSGGDDGPVFNTTVWFDTEMAAVNALNEDNTRFGDVIIRVRRSLPAPDAARPAHCPTRLPARMRTSTLRLRRSNQIGKNTALGAVH